MFLAFLELENISFDENFQVRERLEAFLKSLQNGFLVFQRGLGWRQRPKLFHHECR